jgi:hypothetical protein
VAGGVALLGLCLLRRLQLRADDLIDGRVRREARQVGDAHGLAAHLPPVLVHPGLQQQQPARQSAAMTTHANAGATCMQWHGQGGPRLLAPNGWQEADAMVVHHKRLVPSKQQRTLAAAPASLNCTAAASWSEKVRRRSMSPYTSNTCRREIRACHRAFKTACSVSCSPHVVLHT